MNHLTQSSIYISRLFRTSHKSNNEMDEEGDDEVIENISDDDQDDNLEKPRASGPIPRTLVT